MSDNKGQQLLSLQCLRALAVVMVIYAHSGDQITGPNLVERETGHFGVDIFFLLSGFIMVFISGRRHSPPLAFLRDRIVRIVPVYWFYTLLAVALYLVLPGAFRNTSVAPLHVLQSMFFLPHVNPDTGSTSPLLRLGWTLNYEMFFYLVFAICLGISFTRRVGLAAGAILVLVGAGLLMRSTGQIYDLPPGLAFYFSTIMLEFALGMLIGQAYLAGRLPQLPLPLAGLLILACLYIASLGVHSPWSTSMRGLFWGPLAAVILICTFSFEKICQSPRLAWMVTLGNISYTLYLLHLFPISAYRILWTRLDLPQGSLLAQGLFQVSVIALTCGIGYFAWAWIEQPLVAGARRLLGRSAARPAPRSRTEQT